MDSALPWVQKYRPQTLGDVISHTAIIQTIDRFIKNQHLPHLLLHGPPGTGKTTVAQAIARALYEKNLRYMTLELNASDDRGIQVVRDTIKQFAETRPSILERNQDTSSSLTGTFSSSRKFFKNDLTEKTAFSEDVKLIILDEADQMTGAAQMALRRIIETYTSHVRFLLICNIVNKISPALQSRCTKFRFPPLKQDDIQQRVRHICELEGIQLTKRGMDSLLRIDFRKVLNCLQSSYMGNDGQIVDENHILETAGRPNPEDFARLLPSLVKRSFKECFELLEFFLKEKGYSLSDIVLELYEEMLQYSLSLSSTCLCYPRLAEIQYRLSRGADETVEAANLIALFVSIRADLYNCVSQN